MYASIQKPTNCVCIYTNLLFCISQITQEYEEKCNLYWKPVGFHIFFKEKCNSYRNQLLTACFLRKVQLFKKTLAHWMFLYKSATQIEKELFLDKIATCIENRFLIARFMRKVQLVLKITCKFHDLKKSATQKRLKLHIS
jgi:hypothetical protein